ncbi:MAG: 1-phosphofructokinase family hexose kinase [Rhodospirillales bacterium]
MCVTPNLALDRALLVPGFECGGVWRAEEVRITAGGKGLNVARMLARLDRPSSVVGLLGGSTGERITALTAAAGVRAHWTRIRGETRTSVILADGRGGSTVINEPGPTIGEEEWGRFVGDVGRLAVDAACVVISGSLPPGTPPGAIRCLIAAAKTVPVWVDSSSNALADAIAARVHGLKVNATEVAAVVGGRVSGTADALRAAAAVRQRGVGRVAITLGAAGAVLLDGDGAWEAMSPTVEVRNAVGSGDCFLAGLVAAFDRGEGAETALRLATACGSANATSIGVVDVDPALVRALMPQVTLRRVAFPSA